MFEENIRREILMIDDTVECAKILLQKCRLQTPDIYDTLAAGSLLQTYYNGLENIFKMINSNLDKTPLVGQSTHTELLMLMFQKTEKRNPVFAETLKDDLKNYLGFRHVFRHSYGYKIVWDKVKPLFENLENNWKTVKEAFEIFLKNISI